MPRSLPEGTREYRALKAHLDAAKRHVFQAREIAEKWDKYTSTLNRPRAMLTMMNKALAPYAAVSAIDAKAFNVPINIPSDLPPGSYSATLQADGKGGLTVVVDTTPKPIVRPVAWPFPTEAG